MNSNQAYLFYIFILTGIMIGLVFDIFRILRKSFKTTDILTYIQDSIFWIITGGILIYTIFKFNNGELRSYVFLGIMLGLTIYFILFSKVFIKVNVKIIQIIKKLLQITIKVILYPLKVIFGFIRKILLRPISFIFINIRKNITDILKKIVNSKIQNKLLQKKSKKIRYLKGFYYFM